MFYIPYTCLSINKDILVYRGCDHKKVPHSCKKSNNNNNNNETKQSLNSCCMHQKCYLINTSERGKLINVEFLLQFFNKKTHLIPTEFEETYVFSHIINKKSYLVNNQRH